MPDASYTQSAFLAGEWSDFAQGRIDHPKYKQAMNVCLNTIPLEEGAATRRPGFAYSNMTRNGEAGRLIQFDFTETAPYAIELTDGHARIVSGLSLVVDSISSVVNISTATPAVLQIASAQAAWATGDQIYITFTNVGPVEDGALLRNRTLSLTRIDNTHFALSDPITGEDIVGADVAWDGSTISASAARILDMETPYAGASWQQVRRVQATDVNIVNQASQGVAVLFHPTIAPQALTGRALPSATAFAPFSFSQPQFLDGPYLDAVPGTFMANSGLRGSVTLGVGFQTYDNGTVYPLGALATSGGQLYQSLLTSNIGNLPSASPDAWVATFLGFLASDVGRAIRLLSEPPQWVRGNSYAVADVVTFENAYYVAQKSGVLFEPDRNVVQWLPTESATVFTWTWGVISSVPGFDTIVVDLLGPDLLYEGVINTWQRGVWTAATDNSVITRLPVFPSCGCYYEGRLWTAGAYPNRLDASVSNDLFNFAPTDTTGAVGDGNAISITLDDEDANPIYWLAPTSQGLICGTRSGEWLIQASQLGDPLTPTSVQAHKVTRVRCFNQVPCQTPMTMVLIHAYQRMLFEYFPDVFSGKLAAPNLNSFSKHLTNSGVAELAYQSESTPTVWARNEDGSLVGWVYRRISAFSSEEPLFVAGFKTDLGSGRLVESISVVAGPTDFYSPDMLMIVTNDPATGLRHIELGTNILNSDTPLSGSFYLDDAIVPSGGLISTAGGITLYGLWYLNGKTCTAFIAGLDCGDHQVTDGTMFVPFKSDPGKLFTTAYMEALTPDQIGNYITPVDVITTSVQSDNSQPQTVQMYGLLNTGVVGTGVQLAVDWSSSLAYDNVANSGIRKLNTANVTDVLDQGYSFIGIGAPTSAYVLGKDGNLYWNYGGNNFAHVAQVQASDLTLQHNYVSSTFGFVRSQAALKAGGNYLVMLGLTGAFTSSINVVNTDTWDELTADTYNSFSGRTGIVVAGNQGGSVGTAYILSQPDGTVPATATSVDLYQTVITGGTATTSHIATIVPGQVDIAWSTWAFLNGACFDPSDSGLIIGIQTEDAVTNTCYICKIDTSTGTIKWRVAVPNIPDSNGMVNSRVTGGQYAFITNNHKCYVINTVTGVSYNFSLTGFVGGITSQYYDAVTGQIIVRSSFQQAAGTPIPVPGTPSSFSGWCRVNAGTALFGALTGRTRTGVPAAVGFTYTSRGQILRPAEPQQAGAANGPATGKTRRAHMGAILLAAAITGTVTWGTVYGKLRSLLFKSPGGKPYDTATLYSGTYWDTIEDDYSFDSQLCWEISRPLPLVVNSISGFLQTQDR